MKTIFGNALAFSAVSAMFFLGSCSGLKEEVQPIDIPPAQLEVSAGADQQLFLPVSTVVLEANVKQGNGAALRWSQVAGPVGARLQGADSPTLTVAQLQAGTYVFRVAASAQGKTATDDVLLEVRKLLATEENGSVGLLRQMSWAQSDFQQWEYDAQGRVSALTSQWAASPDGSIVRKLVYRFQYNAQNQLQQVSLPGSVATYVYNAGGQLERIEERNTLGDVLKLSSYTFENGKLVEEIAEQRLASGENSRQLYALEYNAQGNLVKETLYQLGANGERQLVMSTEYSDFDRHLKPDDQGMRRPFVHGAVYQQNNPGRKVTRLANGQVATDERYTYQYGQLGYPVQKTVNGWSHGVQWQQTISYQYE